jgi:hypothetical protein
MPAAHTHDHGAVNRATRSNTAPASITVAVSPIRDGSRRTAGSQSIDSAQNIGADRRVVCLVRASALASRLCLPGGNVARRLTRYLTARPASWPGTDDFRAGVASKAPAIGHTRRGHDTQTTRDQGVLRCGS